MKRMKHASAAVLIYTLLIMSSISFLTQHLMRNVIVHTQYDRFFVKRQQAKMLALGGINLAISQLTYHMKKKKDDRQATEKKEDPEKKNKFFLKRILPHLNRWQTFLLTEKVDGIDGEVNIAISCEDGKINLNEAFDFDKKQFKKEYSDLLAKVVIRGKKRLPKGELLKLLIEYFRRRKKKLDDLSELVMLEELKNIDLFYEPPHKKPKGMVEEIERSIALFDLFTIWMLPVQEDKNKKDDQLKKNKQEPAVQQTKKKDKKEQSLPKIEPWLLSDSMCALLGFRRPQWNDARIMREKFKRVIKEFKKDLGKNWVSNWHILKPIYEKTPPNLANVQKIFTQQFDPKVYTVISSGKIGNVEQKVLAVLVPGKKPSPSSTKNARKQQNIKEKQQAIEREMYDIMKLYWL